MKEKEKSESIAKKNLNPKIQEKLEESIRMFRESIGEYEIIEGNDSSNTNEKEMEKTIEAIANYASDYLEKSNLIKTKKEKSAINKELVGIAMEFKDKYVTSPSVLKLIKLFLPILGNIFGDNDNE